MEKVQRLDGGGQYKLIDSIEVLKSSSLNTKNSFKHSSGFRPHSRNFQVL